MTIGSLQDLSGVFLEVEPYKVIKQVEVKLVVVVVKRRM